MILSFHLYQRYLNILIYKIHQFTYLAGDKLLYRVKRIFVYILRSRIYLDEEIKLELNRIIPLLFDLLLLCLWLAALFRFQVMLQARNYEWHISISMVSCESGWILAQAELARLFFCVRRSCNPRMHGFMKRILGPILYYTDV